VKVSIFSLVIIADEEPMLSDCYSSASSAVHRLAAQQAKAASLYHDCSSESPLSGHGPLHLELLLRLAIYHRLVLLVPQGNLKCERIFSQSFHDVHFQLPLIRILQLREHISWPKVSCYVQLILGAAVASVRIIAVVKSSWSWAV